MLNLNKKVKGGGAGPIIFEFHPLRLCVKSKNV